MGVKRNLTQDTGRYGRSYTWSNTASLGADAGAITGEGAGALVAFAVEEVTAELSWRAAKSSIAFRMHVPRFILCSIAELHNIGGWTSNWHDHHFGMP